MPYQKITLLEDLPELSEVDEESEMMPSHGPNLTSEQARMSKRFIRNNSSHQHMMPESGMTLARGNIVPPPPPSVIEPVEMVPQKMMQRQAPPVVEHYHHMSCQEIFHHVDSCPLCKKFYKNDNTVLLVIIAILVLVCALLFKKVLSD